MPHSKAKVTIALDFMELLVLKNLDVREPAGTMKTAAPGACTPELTACTQRLYPRGDRQMHIPLAKKQQLALKQLEQQTMHLYLRAPNLLSTL